MQIIKPNSLSLIYRTLFIKQRYQLCVSPVLFFSLSQPQKILSEQVGWQKVMASLKEGEALDVGAPKHYAEVILTGTATPLSGRDQRSIDVGYRVGELAHKQVRVFGNQQWQLTRDGWALSDPNTLEPTSLSWENAYGGANYPDNPQGKGAYDIGASPPQTVIELPSIRATTSKFDEFKAVRDGQIDCVGFGPLSITSPIRQQRAGTYDEHWLQNDYPGLAQDHDPAIHNLTQDDQWSTDFFLGDEEFDLFGVNANQACLSGKLPNMQMRAFVQKTSQTSHELTEVDLRMDTLWFFPDQDMGVIISRGLCELEDSDGLDVQSLMIAYERMTDAPRSLDDYREVHRLRTDPQTALAHLLHESQLTPRKTQTQLAQEASEVLAEKQRRQQQIDASLESTRANVKIAQGDSNDEQALASTQPATPELDATKLAEQMSKASRLAAHAKAQGLKPDDQSMRISTARLANTLTELQAQPLERWKVAQGKQVNVNELLVSASQFAEQCKQLDATEAENKAAKVVAMSSDLQEKLNCNQAITPDSLAEQGLDIKQVTNAAQRSVDDYQVQLSEGDQVDTDSGITLSSMSNSKDQKGKGLLSKPATHADTDMQPLISQLETQVKQSGNQPDQNAQIDMPIITPQAIKRGDVDLTAVLEKARQLTEQCERDGKATLAAIKTSQTDSEKQTEPLLSLKEVELEIKQRFKSSQNTKLAHLNADDVNSEAQSRGQAQTQAQTRSAGRLARSAAPFDSTDAKRFNPQVRGFLREQVLAMMAAKKSLSGLDMSGANLSGLDFSGQDLSQTLFESADLSACNFQDANLDGAVLTAAKIDHACFNNCHFGAANLSSVKADKVNLLACHFEQVSMQQASFSNCDFSGSVFNGAIVQDARFHTCQFTQCAITQMQCVSSRMEGLNWVEAVFSQCSFVNSALDGADFSAAEFTRCIFAQSSASGSRFPHAKFDTVQFAGECRLDHSDFSHCVGVAVGVLGIDLSGSSFCGSAFKESNFGDCLLRKVNLDQAGFLRCVFSGAKVQGVSANQANFTESLMRKSHWQESRLNQVDFFNADVKQAIFERCQFHDVKNMGSMYEVRT